MIIPLAPKTEVRFRSTSDGNIADLIGKTVFTPDDALFHGTALSQLAKRLTEQGEIAAATRVIHQQASLWTAFNQARRAS